MKEHLAIGIVVLIIAATVSLSGCTSSGKGELVVKITDAPTQNQTITHVNVTISEVEVHQAGGDNNTTAGWIVVTNQTKTFDLISLKNVTAFFASTNLSAGLYTQVRLQVAACTVTADNITSNATVPSGKIKLNHPWTLKANQITTLTLDFNADKSLHQTGNGKWMLDPVIGITVA